VAIILSVICFSFCEKEKQMTDKIIATEKKQMTDNIIATERKTNDRQYNSH
jgi:hypothetical protein